MAKPKFLLVTDNTSYMSGGARYLGPYRIAHELEKSGVQTFVLDRFYRFPNFFEFLEVFLDESFYGIGISTTFFTPTTIYQDFSQYSTRKNRTEAYYQHGIIDKDPAVVKKWFQTLKEILARKSPKAKLFIGGAKAQHFTHPKYTDLSEIDYVVMGAVDGIFPQVIQDLIAGNPVPTRSISNKKVLDTIGHYHQPKMCPQHEWLSHWHVQPGEALPIEIGRGCAFNCKFCNYDKKENFRKDLSDLKQELITNYELYGTQFYHFVDDCFNDSRAKVESVCNLLISLPFKIEWASYMRFDLAVKFPETMDLVVQSGGRGFHWGVESLTSEVARRAGKGTPSEKIKEFITELNQKYKGLCYSTGSFISGLPGETEQTWNQQVDWLMETDNFHFVQIGPLGIAPYRPDFDGKIMDYADYSRNPAKYGFLEVSPDGQYWKHETMDSIKAGELADQAMARWSEKWKGKRGLSTDIWIYPKLRAHGFSESEVNELYFNADPVRQQQLLDLGSAQHRKWLDDYFHGIWSLTKKSAS